MVCQGPFSTLPRCRFLFTRRLPALHHKVCFGGRGGEPPNSGAFFLTGLSRHKRLCLWPALSPVRAQRVAVCPRLAPGGGNRERGGSNSLLPPAGFFLPPLPPSPMGFTIFPVRPTPPPRAG